MLKHFEIESYEIWVFRIWIILMTIFLPVYGLFLIRYAPGSEEVMLHRWLLSLYWGGLLVLSFVQPQVRKYVALPCYIGNFITIAWIIWIVHVNHFSPDYSIGLYLSLSGIAIINRNNWEMISFYIFCFALLSISFGIQPETEISREVYFLSVFILFLVHVVVMEKRDFITRSLLGANKELEHKNERLKQFVNIASHDLKTPLRTIGSFSSLVKSKIDVEEEEEVNEYLDFILNGVTRMDKILDDLMDYFKYEKGKGDYSYVSFQELIYDLDEFVKKGYSDINVELNWVDPYPKAIRGNSNQIFQLFARIIENSIKYNHEPVRRIDIRYTFGNKHHLFSITDNGIGMSEEYKERVFGLFRRLHHDEEYSGTGVGLAICRAIVENHKGSIWVESTAIGKGTTFCFRIPKKI